ncbi:MAG: tRNA (5-methylaminomethyl-2-thiouridine)(34)-methyltransferase MnmD [Pseudomonadota bacterium]
MSQIEWRDDVLPVSTRFDDPYYSRSDGRAECDHVFIKGNDLPQRWENMTQCTIAELGFGTGLNFLESVRQWQQIRPKDAKLHFVSFEKFPLSFEEMQRALAVWPELNELAILLGEIWNPVSDAIDEAFTEDVRLSVHIGDANEILPSAEFEANAWYLDGFSPAKNPELWNEALMNSVADKTAADGTFSTYSAAGFVRRNLQTAGFQVQKVPGFGRKREMLVGKKLTDI